MMTANMRYRASLVQLHDAPALILDARGNGEHVVIAVPLTALDERSTQAVQAFADLATIRKATATSGAA